LKFIREAYRITITDLVIGIYNPSPEKSIASPFNKLIEKIISSFQATDWTNSFLFTKAIFI
jgi:hypothetical protein